MLLKKKDMGKLSLVHFATVRGEEETRSTKGKKNGKNGKSGNNGGASSNWSKVVLPSKASNWKSGGAGLGARTGGESKSGGGSGSVGGGGGAPGVGVGQVMCETLYKLERKGKKWHARWFELGALFLHYWGSARSDRAQRTQLTKASAPLGAIDLRQAFGVRLYTVTPSDRGPTNKDPAAVQAGTRFDIILGTFKRKHEYVEWVYYRWGVTCGTHFVF